MEKAYGKSVLDIGNILNKASIDHIKQKNYGSFLENVINDGRINARIRKDISHPGKISGT